MRACRALRGGLSGCERLSGFAEQAACEKFDGAVNLYF